MKLALKTDNPTLLTCFGAALGMIVYLCIRAHWVWPAAFFASFAALFFLCFQDDRNAHRTMLFAMGVSAFLIVCGWFETHGSAGADPAVFREHYGFGGKSFYSTILVLIAVPFFMTWIDKGTLMRDYATLHAYTWERPFIYLGGWLFVLILWMVLALWMFLFRAINIGVFFTAFMQPGFIACSIGAGYALGVTMLQGQRGIVASTSNLVSGLFSLLSPILALFAMLFLIMLPFSGIKVIWSTGHTSELLAALAVLAVTFINAVIKDVQVAPSKLLQISAKTLAVVLPFIVILAGTALYIRIDHYGLTPRRIDASVLLFFALLYAFTYMGSVVTHWRSDWPAALRRVNIYNAFFVLAVSAIMLTPLVDLEKLSVAQQKHAYLNGEIKVEDLDLGAMKFKYGKAGLEAYEAIRTAMPGRQDHDALAAKFEAVDKAKYYYEILNTKVLPIKPLTDEDVIGMYEIVPKGTPLPAGLSEALGKTAWRTDGCRKAKAHPDQYQRQCVLLMVDVQGDSAPEVLWIGYYYDLELYVRGSDGAWFTVNTTLSKDGADKRQTAEKFDAIRKGVETGAYKTQPSAFRDLDINGVIVNFMRRD